VVPSKGTFGREANVWNNEVKNCGGRPLKKNVKKSKYLSKEDDFDGGEESD